MFIGTDSQSEKKNVPASARYVAASRYGKPAAVTLWFHVWLPRGKLRVFFSGWKREIFVMATDYKTYMCIICGWIYDEEEGAPEEGLAPGTRWEDVPDSWVCPDCGASKEDFDLVEL